MSWWLGLLSVLSSKPEEWSASICYGFIQDYFNPSCVRSTSMVGAWGDSVLHVEIRSPQPWKVLMLQISAILVEAGLHGTGSVSMYAQFAPTLTCGMCCHTLQPSPYSPV